MEGIAQLQRRSADMVSKLPTAGDKVANASREFESVLLGEWLQQAEESFGSVPGQEDDDAGAGQVKNFAMQHLAQEITKSGGIGISKIVEEALMRSVSLSHVAPDTTAKSGNDTNAQSSHVSRVAPGSISGSSNAN